jgi:MFS family permease
MPERVTGRVRTIALMVVLLAAFMDLMDVTILNVMVPTIEADLHAGPAALEWVLSGYTLTLTVGLISGARLTSSPWTSPSSDDLGPADRVSPCW